MDAEERHLTRLRPAIWLSSIGQSVFVVVWIALVFKSMRVAEPGLAWFLFYPLTFFASLMPMALAGSSLDAGRVHTVRDVIIRKAWVWSSWVNVLGFAAFCYLKF
jgi:hypothetical protein